MRTPEVSIIVYVRDGASTVGRTLDGIRGQDFEEWECLVVDDGSSDQTQSVVRRIAETDRRFIHVGQELAGISKAKNRGFLESTPAAPYVAFIDAGDVWTPDALSLLKGCLEMNPSAVGAYARYAIVEDVGGASPPNVRLFYERRLGFKNGEMVEFANDETSSFESLIWTPFASPSGLFVMRRTGYEKVGLYDPQFLDCHQWDMALRLSRVAPFQFVDRLLLHRWDSGREPEPSGRNVSAEVRRLRRKTFYSRDNSELQDALFRRVWRKWQRREMREKWRGAVAGLLTASPLRGLKAGRDLPVDALNFLAGGPVWGG